MRRGNLHDGLPAGLPDQAPASLADELITVLARGPGLRIERIVSQGQASPPGFWYDQSEDEFVLLVEGGARLQVGEVEHRLGPGDWIDIPAHVRHRVSWTDPDRLTVWLAVFRGTLG
jgi:cupin 2 domain-containing protein